MQTSLNKETTNRLIALCVECRHYSLFCQIMMAWIFLTINCQKILGMCQKICQALFSFMYLIFWWNHLKLSVVKISLIRFQTGFTPITKCLQNLSIQFVVLSFLHPIHFNLRQRILACVKVIYMKYSKHWPYTVAHIFDCVCSKINNSWFNPWFSFYFSSLYPAPYIERYMC